MLAGGRDGGHHRAPRQRSVDEGVVEDETGRGTAVGTRATGSVAAPLGHAAAVDGSPLLHRDRLRLDPALAHAPIETVAAVGAKAPLYDPRALRSVLATHVSNLRPPPELGQSTPTPR